jgi:hypothetical protein
MIFSPRLSEARIREAKKKVLERSSKDKKLAPLNFLLVKTVFPKF